MSQANVDLIDAWTAVHIGVGFLAGLLKVPPLWAFGGAIAYEGIEQVLERSQLGQSMFNTSGPESFGNSAVDVVVFGAAYVAGWSLVTKSLPDARSNQGTGAYAERDYLLGLLTNVQTMPEQDDLDELDASARAAFRGRPGSLRAFRGLAGSGDEPGFEFQRSELLDQLGAHIEQASERQIAGYVK